MHWKTSAPNRSSRADIPLAPPDDPEALGHAVASIDRFDWIVFESAVAAARFLSILSRGSGTRGASATSICTIGPSTSQQLQATGSNLTS
jgi:uroporphyrinogen-III synthase